MTRKELLSELSRCAFLYGYPFKTGQTCRINSELSTAPQIWAEPPQLVRKSGRGEGVREYRIIMRLIDTPLTPEDKEQALDKMEDSLCRIISALEAHDDVLKTDSLEYSTEENTLTNRGDISLKAIFTIKTRY